MPGVAAGLHSEAPPRDCLMGASAASRVVVVARVVVIAGGIAPLVLAVLDRKLHQARVRRRRIGAVGHLRLRDADEPEARDETRGRHGPMVESGD